MKSILNRFVKDERGLETVEYAVMGGLVVAALVIVIAALSTAVQARFQALITAIS
jgi:pilus assembly protein Flp/PilA